MLITSLSKEGANPSALSTKFSEILRLAHSAGFEKKGDEKMNSCDLDNSLASIRGHITAKLLVCAMCVLSLAPAYADDPCLDTDREVARAVSALQRFDHLIANDGVFQVRKLAREVHYRQMRLDLTFPITWAAKWRFNS